MLFVPEQALRKGGLIGSLFSHRIRKATTNLVTNGGFETNTTGWGAQGSNTIARSTAQAKFGAASLLATYQNDPRLAQFTLTATAVAHSASIWVYVPSGQSLGSGVLRLSLEGFTSATGTLTADVNLALFDQWQQVQVPSVTPDAGDLSGTFMMRWSTAPTAGTIVYLDGAQFEAQPLATPYVHTDGAAASRAASRLPLAA